MLHADFAFDAVILPARNRYHNFDLYCVRVASSTSLACSTLTSTFMPSHISCNSKILLSRQSSSRDSVNIFGNLSVDVVGTYASEKGSRVAKRTGFVPVAHTSRKSVCSSSGVGGRVLATLGSGFGSSYAEAG